jgi:hypothetical protein
MNKKGAPGTAQARFSLMARKNDRGQSEMQSDPDQDHFIKVLAESIEENH